MMMNKRESAIEVLERTISFINNCDNKASIFLGILGVIFSVILSGDISFDIYNYLFNDSILTFCDFLYYIFLFGAIVVFLFGVGNLISVLYAKVKINCDDKIFKDINQNTLIFFDHIYKNNTYKQFKKRFVNMNDDDYLNDILSEIYFNSMIASEKYKKYNTGVKYIISGFILFIILLFFKIFVA